MKKKILVTGLLVSVLSIASYADGGNSQDRNMMMNSTMKQQKGMMNMREMMPRYGMMMKRRGMMGHHSKMMSMFRQLNLDENQRYKISIVRDEMKLDIKKLMGPNRRKEMLKFITNNGFDKVAFKKHMDEVHSKMLNIKADSMEKIFNILTKEQIVRLKTNMAN